MQPTQAVAPAAVAVPAAHVLHAPCPAPSAYLPAGQVVEDAAPVAAKRPGADAPTLRRATELYRRHSVAHAEELPEAARGPNTPREPVLGRPGAAPPEETRIRGSKIPAILRTPRDAPR